MRLDAMRLLEDAGKNGWTMADFSVMIVTVNIGPYQIGRTAFTVPNLSLSTIRRATRTRVSTMISHRRLLEQNLRLYRPLLHLPFTYAHCLARLQCCLA
ncbi:hypothetical protein TNCV_4119531 [Trichonephila clavipes]|nr:hypothetical protein TNCV_4119531 [Trichonephila clavipes]